MGIIRVVAAHVAIIAALGLVGCTNPQQMADPEPTVQEEPQNQVEDLEQELEIQPRQLKTTYSRWQSVYPERAAAFDSAWPVEFSRRDLADTALAAAFEYFSTYANPELDDGIDVVIQDGFPELHHEWITRSAKMSIGLFRNYTDATATLFVGLDGEWLYQTAKEMGVALPGGSSRGQSRIVPFRECCMAATEGDSGWAFGEMAWAGYSESVRNGRLRTHPILNNVAHEMFHLVHGYIDGSDTFSWNFGSPDSNYLGVERPLWMVEGSASFFAAAINDYADIYPYYDTVWEPHATGWYTSPIPGLENHVTSWDGESEWLETFPAWMDMKAVEYIVANRGVEAWMNVFVRMADGLSFEDAFLESVGISVPEFYEVFDVAYENMMREFLLQVRGG